MIKKTLDDGTVLIAYYDSGFSLYIYCACAGGEQDGHDPITLSEVASEVCPACGKRYETMFVPTVDVTVNGDYEVSF